MTDPQRWIEPLETYAASTGALITLSRENAKELAGLLRLLAEADLKTRLAFEAGQKDGFIKGQQRMQDAAALYHASEAERLKKLAANCRHHDLNAEGVEFANNAFLHQRYLKAIRELPIKDTP